MQVSFAHTSMTTQRSPTNPPCSHILKVVNSLHITYCPLISVTRFTIMLRLQQIFAALCSSRTYYITLSMIRFRVLFTPPSQQSLTSPGSFRARFWYRCCQGFCIGLDAVDVVIDVIKACSDLVLLLLPTVCM